MKQTSEKTKALRMADWCDTFNTVQHDKVGAELRRLHQDYMQMKAENDRLRARNAELVEAEIKLRLDHQHPHTVTLGAKLRHAISKREASAS